MSGQIREDALAAMIEGIISVFHATEAEGMCPSHDPLDHCMTYAQAAITSLEAGGFTIVWKGTPAGHRNWRDGKIVPLR